MPLVFPVVFRIGQFHIAAHAVFESLAYTIGFAWYRHLRGKSGDFLAAPERITVIVAAILGAAFGSRFLYWLEDPALTWRHVFDPGYLLAGKTIVGGLIGGVLAVEWIKRRAGITRRTGDLFALPLVAAIAIGRIGCFLGGLPDHTYGIATTLPWGIDFGDGVRRHPTQIYEIVFLIALAPRLARPPRREGDSFRLFLIAYLAFRAVIDFLKPEVRFAGLTAIQWTSLAAILTYWRDILFFAQSRNTRQWENESAPTSSTTPPHPSAPNAIGAATPK